MTSGTFSIKTVFFLHFSFSLLSPTFPSLRKRVFTMSAYTSDAARAFLQSLLEVMGSDLSLNWGEWSMLFH